MAEKISVQIALEGGAEIARQLADIGKAGQQAFADISKSAEQVGFQNIKPEQVTAALQKFGVEGSAAVDKVTAAVQRAAQLETIVKGVQGVESAMVALGRAAVIVGPAIAAAFVAASKATIGFAETINKASDQAVQLGMSLQQFKSFQQDMQQLGVSSDAAAAGFAKFQQELQKAAQADPGSNLALFGQNAAAAQQQLNQFIERLRQMPDGLERTNLAISKLGEAAGTQLIQGLRRAEGSMTSAEQKAYDLGQAVQGLSRAWADFGSVSIAPIVTAEINAITAALQMLQNLINNFSWSNFVSAAAAAGQAVEWLTPGGLLSKGLREIIELLGKAGAGLPARTGGEAGAIPGIASGGVIGGRGTGTSDSNLAWVSRGEHIMPARAVAQPGVLAFLEALRRSGGNLSHVLDGMGRFALGGLVPRPAYAGGGAVGSMSHVTINFPGLEPIGGLRASAGVVEQLQRAAALAQVRSGGRKPSRYS